jgi:hypothetical protein
VRGCLGRSLMVFMTGFKSFGVRARAPHHGK